jgi:hypothetical protein
VSPLAFLVGPVQVEYGGDPAATQVTDLSGFIDTVARTVTSITEEVTMDYGRGICVVNSPRAQGAAGFLSAQGTFDLDDVRIVTTNTYASVLVTSIEGRLLSESNHILVQVGTIARPTNWQVRQAVVGNEPGLEIVNFGTSPWRLKNTEMTVGIRNPSLTEMATLDMNGMVTATAALTLNGEYREAVLPTSTMYVLFRDPDAPVGTPPTASGGNHAAPLLRATARAIVVENLGPGARVDMLDISGRRVDACRAVRGRASVSGGSAAGIWLVRCRDGRHDRHMRVLTTQ